MADEPTQAHIESFHTAPFITCNPCHRLISIFDGNPIASFVSGRGPECPSCHKRVDIWEFMLQYLEWGQVGVLPTGTWYTQIVFKLHKHGRTTIVLSEHGIPKDARIIERRYCGQDNTRIWPLEIHGGAPQLGPIWEGKLTLYGASYGDAPDAEVSTHMLSVTWVPPGLDAEGLSGLWSAIEALAKYDHDGVVVPANVAVELTLVRIVSTCLRSIPGASSDNVKKFLGDCDYSHHLNVVLPTLVHFANAPKMSPELRGDLNSLKTLRNQIAHEGKTKNPVTRKQAARLVRAAIFGFHYMHVVETCLRSAGGDGSVLGDVNRPR